MCTYMYIYMYYMWVCPAKPRPKPHVWIGVCFRGIFRGIFRGMCRGMFRGMLRVMFRSAGLLTKRTLCGYASGYVSRCVSEVSNMCPFMNSWHTNFGNNRQQEMMRPFSRVVQEFP